MKIRHIDYSSAIIEVSKPELTILTGIRYGDNYGNHGPQFSTNLVGKEYDLHKLRKNIEAMKFSIELRTRAIDDLQRIQTELKTVLYPLEEDILEGKS